jgi:DNA-binding SARP family transcriptional activator/TolB-like protein
MFWPEATQNRARNALNQAMHFLRRGLRDDILATRGAEEIRLDPEQLWCDAVAFEAALEAGRTVDGLELYGGDLLKGFYLSDCPEFEQWLELERARLRERASAAAWSLAGAAEAADNAVEAAHWGRQAVAFAPGDEEALRRLVALLDRIGDRAGALRDYEAFAERLWKEYEVEPAPETRELIATIRARAEPNGNLGAPAPVATRAQDVRPIASTDRPEPGRAPWLHGRRKAVGAAALAVAALAAGVLAFPVQEASKAPSPLDPTRVLVGIFANETGDPSLDHLGRMAADWITQGLTYTGFVDVVSFGTPLLTRPLKEGIDPRERNDLAEVARAHGTGTVIQGGYYRQGDTVVFQARVTRARDGDVLAAIGPVAGHVGETVDAAERLRDRVTTTLATLTDPRLAKWARYASKPPTFEAYKEFVEGIELHTHAKFREAIPHFLRAAALDSNFTMASLWAAFAYGNAGQRAPADSLRQALDRRRGQLAPLDRLLLDYQLGYYGRDRHSALEAMRRFVEIAPGSEYLYKAGLAALMANRPREAIGFLTQADSESGWLRGWVSYWNVFTLAYHRLGEHREELAVARRARRLFPDKRFLLERELQALGALGRTDEVQVLLEEGQETGLALAAARELLVHDHLEAASQVLDRGIMRHQAWLSTPSTDTTSSQIDGGIGQLADMLLLHGRVDEARVVLERAVEERGDSLLRRGHVARLGVIAAMQGDRRRALEIYQDLGAQPWEGRSRLVWQARIAASLGEIDKVTALLREAVGKGWAPHAIHYQSPLLLRVLRDHPPFQELMRPKG